MGCYGVRRGNIIPSIVVTVNRCASANKPCLVGGWVKVGGCRLVGEWVVGVSS